MKLLLVLEHRFFILPGGETVYCERNVDYSFLQRYLQVFDEVTVCARAQNVSSDFKGKLLSSGKNVSFLPLPDFRGSTGIIKNYGKCRKIIRDNIAKFDAVMLRSPSPISLAALNPVIKSKKPFAAEFVINPRTMFDKDSNPTRKAVVGLMQALFVGHARKLCRTANGVSYVTEYVLQEEFPCRAILEGESEQFFTEHYSTINISKQDYSEVRPSPKQGEPVVVCHTGYMDGYSKGHLAVMDVVKNCLDDGLNVEIHFIGSGTIEETFKKYAEDQGISDHVKFLGQQYGYKQVQKALMAGHIFLFPTRSEGLPRSLIEAMANGLACVSSPIDGIKELLDPEFLVDYKDVQGMTRIVEELVRNDDKRIRVATKNYMISQKYEASILNERRISYYSKLLELAKTKAGI